MRHIDGLDRHQLTLFPEALDDYISQDNPVRFLDAFVDSLALQAVVFAHATPKQTGRPPYHPGDLLKLYLYGYLNRIRSSRQLEREAGRNVERMWLLRRLTPDFKTIADFRKENREAIGQVCREFTLMCGKPGLFGGELVAIDGSKFKASNSRDRNFTASKLERRLGELDKKLEAYLEAYLKELDEADQSEGEVPKPTAAQLEEKIECPALGGFGCYTKNLRRHVTSDAKPATYAVGNASRTGR